MCMIMHLHSNQRYTLLQEYKHILNPISYYIYSRPDFLKNILTPTISYINTQFQLVSTETVFVLSLLASAAYLAKR